MGRRPWVAPVVWAALVVLALPILSHLNTATTNSATQLPSSALSSQAEAELEREFPNLTTPSESVVLLLRPNITGEAGEHATLAVSAALRADSNLTYVGHVETVYDAYATYLEGMVQLASGVVNASNPGSPAYEEMNSAAAGIWGPPATFVGIWSGLVAAAPGVPPSTWNGPALLATSAVLGTNLTAQAVLYAFYGSPDAPGFAGTNNCAADPATVTRCADSAARATLPPLVSTVFSSAPSSFGSAAVGDLGVENYSFVPAVENATAAFLLNGSTLPSAWVSLVRAQFPSGTESWIAIVGWASLRATEGGLDAGPLPVPGTVLREFVDPGNDAAVVLVTFTQPAEFTTSTGTTPVHDDVAEIQRVVPTALASAGASGVVGFVETGEAPLVAQESSDLDHDLALVVPLTVVVLAIITFAYFRSPIATLATFGALGIAVAVSLAGVYLVGHTLTKVDVTSIPLATTFVLGVGTDYSIFLVARYREELVKGRTPADALVTSYAWAGQSIATSGTIAIVATLALVFSGVAMLSQWGVVLSLSVLVTLLVALTLVPSILALLGPRLFWPISGPRFRREALREEDRLRKGTTYFARAGRFSQRHAALVIGLALVVSVPAVYLTVTAPVGYDFFGQLPTDEPATSGLATLSSHFGAGYAFPLFVLLTFQGPLLAGNRSNATEFGQLGQVTGFLQSNSQIAEVASPIGAGGAPLASWENFSSLPAVEQARLSGVLASYVGEDGRSIDLGVQLATNGVSNSAIEALTNLRSNLTAFQSTHPDVQNVAIGGGAAIDADLQSETLVATERMVVAVTIGIAAVLLAVLRSWLLAVLAVVTIALSFSWAWSITYLTVSVGFGRSIFYFVPTIVIILVLGLGTDYNIFLLTRIREERVGGRSTSDATTTGVARTGGIITAAAVILAGAFASLLAGKFLLLQSIGLAVAVAVVLDAALVRTYLVPAALHLWGSRVWLDRRDPPPDGAAPREDSG